MTDTEIEKRREAVAVLKAEAERIELNMIDEVLNAKSQNIGVARRKDFMARLRDMRELAAECRTNAWFIGGSLTPEVYPVGEAARLGSGDIVPAETDTATEEIVAEKPKRTTSTRKTAKSQV